MNANVRIFLAICLAFLFNAATVFASPLLSNVDIKVQNVTVEQAIATLNKTQNYSIVVNPEGLDLEKRISLDLKNAKVEEVLDRIFTGQSVRYNVEGKRILIEKAPKHTPPQQKKPLSHKVSGKVSDQDGEAIPGAVVLEVGGSASAMTGNDGTFSIPVPSDALLLVSCLGFKDKEVRVKGNDLTIILETDTKILDEVVVVGYGTQKKVNLTGSVASVNLAELTESRPITNLSNALAGLAAGVNVTSNANKPGSDNATILVRGQGTLNSSAPLVIVDGVESSYNSVNPQDVESISVLKDAASAAIYGSRAANGVILITTKEGRPDQFKLDYHGYVSIQSAKKTMNIVSNYADYMEYANEACINSEIKPYFSQESIDLWRNDNGANPFLYPNTDWFDAMFKTSVAHNHLLSMNGGTKNLRAYVSMGFLGNPGVMENSGEKKVTLRANFDGTVNKYIKMGMKLDGYYQKLDLGTLSLTGDDVFQYIYSLSPCVVPKSPDGHFGGIQNPEDDTQNSSLVKSLYSKDGYYNRYRVNTNIYTVITPVRGLSITGRFRYSLTQSEQQFKPVFNDSWDFRTETITMAGTGRSYITKYGTKGTRLQWEVLANYNEKFIDDKFGLNILAGTNQELYGSDTFSVTKYDLVDMSLSSLDAAYGESASSGHKTEWSMHSYFARVNLDWEGKYLLEANFRADGSSRFRPDRRWGFFPSVSAGWRISEEKFLKDSPVSNLKIRASYGSLGNNSVGNYASLSTLTDAAYSWNSEKVLAVYQSAIANSNITWETTYVADAGIDFGFFKGRLNGTVDYFDKVTDGILISLPAPTVHGTATIPTTNAAMVSNRGIEFTLGWNDSIGDFRYSINGNFTWVKNKVEKFKGDDYSLAGTDYIKEGLPINSQYGLRVDRIIQTDEDMETVMAMIGKNPDAFAAFGMPQMGDFLYKDLNGDGKIDNNDREIISDGPLPKCSFGLNFSLGWKGLDFSVLFQGQAGGSRIICSETDGLVPVFRLGRSLNKDIVEGRWYEGRTDASWPRLLEYSDKRNIRASDFYLENLSFLKIRNIQLGYTLPAKWTKKAAMDKVRFYCSLENFFTFTSYRLIDPETSAVDYPTIRQAVFGLNITF